MCADGDCSRELYASHKRCLLLGRKAMTNLVSILKSKDITDKGPSSQNYSFSSSHVWMWELDYKESWVLKNWCFWTLVLEKTLQSPLDCMEIKLVNCKWNQSWIFIGRMMLKLKLQSLATWCEELTHWKRHRCWARLRAGGEGDDRGWDGWIASLTQWTWAWASSGSWWWTGKPGVLQSMGHKELDTTERLNWIWLKISIYWNTWLWKLSFNYNSENLVVLSWILSKFLLSFEW